MYFDNENIFSKKQAVKSSGPSDNVIDVNRSLGRQKDVGPGTPVHLFITVSDTFAGLSSLSVAFETSNDADFKSKTVLLQTGTVPVAQLKQGYSFPLTVAPDGCERYVRLYYTVAGTGTAGTITAGIVVDRQQTRNFGGITA